MVSPFSSPLNSPSPTPESGRKHYKKDKQAIEEWQTTALNALEKHARQNFNHTPEAIVSGFEATIVSTTPFHSKIQEALQHDNSLQFLIPLQEIHDATTFLKTVKKLDKTYQKICKEVIGGEEANKILSRCKKKTDHKEWTKYISLFQSVHNIYYDGSTARTLVSFNSPPIKIGGTPTDVIHSLRAFRNMGIEDQTAYFYINSEPFYLQFHTNAKDIDDEYESYVPILTALINGLEKSIHQPSQLSARKQAELLYQISEGKVDEKALSQIPSYPILQSLAMTAFVPADTYIRTQLANLFPNIHMTKPGDLIMQPQGLVHFQITITSRDTGYSYETTHIKKYAVYNRGEASREIEKPRATMDCRWIIKGTSNGDSRTAKIQLHNVVLDQGSSLPERLEVLGKITPIDQKRESK